MMKKNLERMGGELVFRNFHISWVTNFDLRLLRHMLNNSGTSAAAAAAAA